LKTDHITVCGSDLEALRRVFHEAGLPSEYGGSHANGVTHMALVGFEDDSYLELIAPLAHSGNATGLMAGWAKFMEANAGPSAWAVESADIAADVERLKASGIGVRGPLPGSRTRPDGKVLEWATATVGAGPAGSVLPFMIQDKTPRSWRVQPSTALHGSGLMGVAAVVLGVRDLAKSTSVFRNAYGWGAPTLEENRDFDATLASFAETPVVLAAPAHERSWLHKRLEGLGECPAAFLLRTQSVSHAAQRFPLRRSGGWFGRPLAWFDQATLRETRLGIIE
jgi:hypothetical protein